MIILDLSEYTGKRPTTWPDDIPKKIRLVEGKHAKEYNIHPTHRRTKWYKKLVKNIQVIYPYKRPEWPIGLDLLDLKPGTKIMENGRVLWPT